MAARLPSKLAKFFAFQAGFACSPPPVRGPNEPCLMNIKGIRTGDAFGSLELAACKTLAGTKLSACVPALHSP